MIKFEELVLEQLLTEGVLPAGPHALKDFYDNHSDELKEITAFFASKFSIVSWPNSTTFLTTIADAASRTNATPLIPFVKFFPLMDFLWFVADKMKSLGGAPDIKGTLMPNSLIKIAKGSGATEILDTGTGAEGIPKEFLDASTGYTDSSNPLYGYNPLSTTGVQYLGLLQRKYQNDFLGEFNLKTFDEFSLKRALYGLLELRKKTRKSVVNVDKIPQDVEWINDILENPQKYSGQIQIPPKLKDLYDNASASQIIQIAKAFEVFYEAEKANVINKLSLASTDQPDETFSNFISNLSKPPLFTFTFSGLGTTSGTISAPKGTSTNLDGKTGGYLIKNVKLMDNSDPAKEVINLLQNFGNYISQGEPKEFLKKTANVLNKAASAAEGALFGVKIPGM